jgi:hypothetical protein
MWKQGSDWDIRVDTVIRYYADRPYLKFGPRKLNKAFPVLDTLCAQGEALRAELMQVHGLDTYDDVMTILSNVTMAIQGKASGRVWSPSSGGWYTSYCQINGDCDTLTYIVCPGFAEAWKVKRRYK